MALHERIPLLIVIVLALAAVLAACGPADAPVQERIGNIPVAEPPQPAPQEGNSDSGSAESENEEEETPTPLPTKCYLEDSEDGTGLVQNCEEQEHIQPGDYEKLTYRLKLKVQELEAAQERAEAESSESARQAAVQAGAERVRVYVIPKDYTGSTLPGIKKFLESKGGIAIDEGTYRGWAILKVTVPISSVRDLRDHEDIRELDTEYVMEREPLPEGPAPVDY